MLKQQIQYDMKSAMKSGNKSRLGTIRLIMAAVKQREVDERIELNDEQVLAVLDKMVKQRRDSITQYEQAGRTDLADKESAEIEVIKDYLPEALGDDAITALITEAITSTGASGMADMGKVMGRLKPKIQGRADMGAVSALVKQQLAG
ncbi:MAG: glutamyl-tRNA amidotransferase [Sedimenticola sp.]|nr:MAG: glutamyl-tRNA amidotransferase [Sedimenticola sp.]